LKISIISGCKLAFVLLIGFSCCEGNAAPGPPTAHQDCLVNITVDAHGKCNATVDQSTCAIDPTYQDAPWVNPDHRDTVRWSPSGYTAQFNSLLSSQHSPFHTSSVGSGHAESAVRDGWCARLGICKYEYHLNQSGTACGDPGVRVVPPPTVYVFYFLLVSFVGFGSYALFRIRARN
jgi:hypothetical protein